jgi:hypothetical protein
MTITPSSINEYHKQEIAEIFSRTREHRSQRTQIYSFLGTAHLVVLGIAFNNKEVGLIILGTSLLLALIIIDYTLKRTLSALEFRGIQLERMYAPDPDMALMHLLIATSYSSSKQLDKYGEINEINDYKKQRATLRNPTVGLTSSLFLPFLVIVEVWIAVSLWNTGWKIF